MNKPFKVKAVTSGRVHAISFSLDSTRPEEYYATLEKSLARLNIDGEILLDLLACNGQTSRRFFTVQFDGERLNFQTLRVAKAEAIEPSLLAYCAEFYGKYKAKLQSTVLSTPALKKLSTVGR
jgi:hypothetical protein